jgi:signal transduction histidine kinase
LTQRAVNVAKAQLDGGATLNHRVRLEFEPPLADIKLRADAAQLEGAVLNLIINALEAIGDEGEVNVSVRRAASDSEAETEEEAVIDVSDNGRGMSDDDLAQIFNPFFTTTQGGTGLGLPAVRRIARAHGGRVEVSSSSGKGSSFSIHLPLTNNP